MQLPVIAASGNYPYAYVKWENHEVTLKVPNGEIQTKLAASDKDDSIDVLLHGCVEIVNQKKPDSDFFRNLTNEQLNTMESALEEISPFVCSDLTTDCPECGAHHQISLGAYALTATSLSRLYKDIHTLAIHYHWSEDDILSLSRERRKIYLEYIETARGMST
jgi:hypothetical protein